MQSLAISPPASNSTSTTSAAQSHQLASSESDDLEEDIVSDDDTADVDSTDMFVSDVTLADTADVLMKMVDDDLAASDSDSESETVVEGGTERNETVSNRALPNQESRSHSSTDFGSLPLRMDIADIFDFSQTYWVDAVQKEAEAGIANEAELCELLGQDGADTTMYTDV